MERRNFIKGLGLISVSPLLPNLKPLIEFAGSAKVGDPDIRIINYGPLKWDGVMLHQEVDIRVEPFGEVITYEYIEETQ